MGSDAKLRKAGRIRGYVAFFFHISKLDDAFITRAAAALADAVAKSPEAVGV